MGFMRLQKIMKGDSLDSTLDCQGEVHHGQALADIVVALDVVGKVLEGVDTRVEDSLQLPPDHLPV